ncbi:phosphate ABC transporter substrate-binding protein [Geobacter sp. FeAm09]|uniref:substrate-binding domain-containing protein n=1 Tax=Geobacter sp. FeAm09 TaxID=2597769 RepID=UPI0011EF19CD|nr:substrate-binding domain-containing protein [Geobacter sp. FeAm09]QEM68251.1 phosphate ABC transporter substrate-binding protein [Geobacter sp. FeAm09]
MKRIALALAFMTAVTTGATTTVQADEIKVGGGGAPIDNFIRPVRDSFEKKSGNKVNIIFTSATIAFKQLANNEIDVSAAGSTFEELLASARKDGLDVKDPAAYQHAVIGQGNIYVVVNKNNPVGKLTGEQVKGIFTGKLSNWKDVGGSDAPIIVVLSNQNPATMGSFKKLALNKEEYAKDVIEAAKFEDIRNVIASNPEAVGFGPYSMIDATVKKVETPDYARPIIAVTKGKPSPKVQQLLDYIKGEGKQFTKN